MQSGADLDAKTKNGETPFDICEDPDLKSRILQIRNEIESKRAVSSNRLRRSHSQNTRTHSIRRTSIREKSQIAKREAIEEARIWHEKSIEGIETKKEDEIDGEMQFLNDYNNKISNTPIELNNIDIHIDSDDSLNQFTNVPSRNHLSAQNNQKSYNEKSVDVTPYVNNQHLSNNQIVKDVSKAENQNIESYYPNYYNNDYNRDNKYHEHNINSHLTGNESSTSESVKVEIHVTVNTNSNSNPNANYNNSANSTGTLIDLKKQRSEKHRNSLNNIYSDRMMPPMDQSMLHVNTKQTSLNMNNINYHQLSSTNSNIVPTPPVITVPVSSKLYTESHHFNNPPSPSSVKKKFCGNPSELIGEEEKKGCCVVC